MSNEKEGEKPNGRKSKGSNRERNVSWVKRSLIESWKARKDGEVKVTEGAENNYRKKEKGKKKRSCVVKERVKKPEKSEPQKERIEKKPYKKPTQVEEWENI